MRWLGKEGLRLFRGQRGMSLLEVVIAVGILGLIGTGIVGALDTNYRADRTLDEQVTATNLAAAHIEAIRELPFAATYPSVGDNITPPAQYSVVINTECSSDGDTFSPCTGSANETFQRIIISVSREGGKPVLSICAYRTKK